MSREFWEGDKLDRKASADFLTKYLTSKHEAEKDHADGSFVLAINADWGYGKTFLLQNWEQDLKELGYPTAYFNAWQNDYTSEPLVGFIAELNASLENQFKRVVVTQELKNRFLYSSKQVLKALALTGLGIVAKRLTHTSIEEMREAYNDHAEDNEQDPELGSIEEEAVAERETWH